MELFTVRVAGPGTSYWGVIVRAESEEAAAAAVASRGHRVIGVRRGMAERPRPGVVARAACVRCGYAIGDLPAGAAGEVMCPECGVVNTPDLVETEAAAKIRARGRMWRRLAWWIVAIGFGSALVTAAWLNR